MQKLVNFRAFLIIFVGAMLGIIFSFAVINKNLFALICGGVICLSLLTFFFITKVFKRQKKFDFINKFIICLFIGFILFFSIGLVNYKIYNNDIEDVSNASVSARVCYKSEKSSYNYLILEDATIKNLDTNKTTKLNGKISLIVYSEDYIDSFNLGDEIYFIGALVKNDLIKDNKFNSYYYKNSIKYSCFISEESFSKISGNLKFDEIVREKVKNLLYDNLSYDNASICYASIFGDKTLLDDNIYNSFSGSGTAHLLCVSGLHVGFLVALLYFVFNLLRIKKKYIFIILSVLLIFYSYLCGFSPSVVRASIMSIILAGSTCFGNFRYDNLSSLSFAGLIILLFSPFMLFDVGFELSFASCFGIFLLMPLFTKFFKKINFDNKFSRALSLTMSAQIGTFPIILHNFEKLSFLSIIANMLIVPLFSILFMMLVIFVLINLILPLNFLFKTIEVGLNFIIFLTKSFGSVSGLVYYSSGSKVLSTAIFYLAIILVSGFVNLKNKTKVASMLICTVLISCIFLARFIPENYTVSTIINSNADAFTVITNSDNQKILIVNDECDLTDFSTLKTELLDNKILKLNIVVMGYYNSNMQETVAKICNNYSVETLYLSSNIAELDEKYLYKNLHNTSIYKTNNEYCNFSNFTFKIIDNLNLIEVSLIDNAGIYNMFFAKSFNKNLSTYLVNYNKSGEYFKTNYVSQKYIASLDGFDNIICKNSNANQINIFKISKINDKITIGEEINHAI